MFSERAWRACKWRYPCRVMILKINDFNAASLMPLRLSGSSELVSPGIALVTGYPWNLGPDADACRVLCRKPWAPRWVTQVETDVWHTRRRCRATAPWPAAAGSAVIGLSSAAILVGTKTSSLLEKDSESFLLTQARSYAMFKGDFHDLVTHRNRRPRHRV